MRVQRRSAWQLVAIVAVLAAVASACGGTGDADVASTGIPRPTATPEATRIAEVIETWSEFEIDVSGAAATGDTPLPDFVRAVAGDDAAERLPLDEVTTPASDDRLDFLFERCNGDDECHRDAVFVNPDDPSLVTAAWQGDRPFHVRHGFINEGEDPLGDDFDVVLYSYQWDNFATKGTTYRYTSDSVLRGRTEECGPTYRSLTGPVTCEWFVHEFPEGLPVGRHALWAFWEAPCSAWLDYGFADGCTDPDETMTLFAAGVNSPWERSEVVWDRR